MDSKLQTQYTCSVRFFLVLKLSSILSSHVPETVDESHCHIQSEWTIQCVDRPSEQNREIISAGLAPRTR